MDKEKSKTQKSCLSDEEIIELYWQRNEKAIEETSLKYQRYLYTVAYNIINDHSDCEECLNDTYLGVWHTIPPTRPDYFKAFITVIMRRNAINRYNRNNRKSTVPSQMTEALSELEFLLSDEESAFDTYDNKELSRLLSEFVFSLSRRRKFIFMGRYYAAESIASIAEELHLSKSTVKKELATIRLLLKEKLEKEGYSI